MGLITWIIVLEDVFLSVWWNKSMSFSLSLLDITCEILRLFV